MRCVLTYVVSAAVLVVIDLFADRLDPPDGDDDEGAVSR